MRKKRRSVRTKGLIMLFATMVIVSGTIGGSLAWFVDKTPDLSVTFTVGSISANWGEMQTTSTFSLSGETQDDMRMIPGWTLTIKDPPIDIGAGSEDCYLFVKIDEDIGSFPQAPFQSYLSYALDDGWTAGTDANGVPVGVYYRVVNRAEEDQRFNIIKNHEVKVSEDITREMMEMLSAPDATLPTLTFSAYAVQLYSGSDVTFSPAEAWAKTSTPANTPTTDVNG